MTDEERSERVDETLTALRAVLRDSGLSHTEQLGAALTMVTLFCAHDPNPEATVELVCARLGQSVRTYLRPRKP